MYRLGPPIRGVVDILDDVQMLLYGTLWKGRRTDETFPQFSLPVASIVDALARGHPYVIHGLGDKTAVRETFTGGVKITQSLPLGKRREYWTRSVKLSRQEWREISSLVRSD